MLKDTYTRSIFLSVLIILVAIFFYHSYLAEKIDSLIKTKHQYNIIFIISDQNAYRLLHAKNYRLQAREELASHGVTFSNHYVAAAMCSPSRAALLTGVPPQKNHIFDQEEYSYVPVLDPNRPNMGSILHQLGYRTAYYGKFEMNKNLLSISDTTNYSTLARSYGFDSFNYDGDFGGQPQQGYTHDPYFVGEAIRWLRKTATNDQSKPFFLVISLLNPHDIMYGDANLPHTIQAQKPLSPVIMPPPSDSLYQTQWEFNLPSTLNESLLAKGMPDALNQYQQGWSSALGFIPTNREDMWHFYYNYYLNAIRDNDNNLQLIVDTLNQMNLWENTIVIFTADHGEMGGAHGGLRGKGPMAYEENIHVPLIIAHPNAPQGVVCDVLTSHLDLLPTLIGFTENSQASQINKQFPGHDFSSLVIHPQNTNVNILRAGILFNYVGVSTIDAKYLSDTLVSSFSHKTLPPLSQDDFNKRGFLASTFDGRYKFTRFYAPNHSNTPQTIQDIFQNNDVQLFDLTTDPLEVNNLVLNPEKNKEIILRMNALLNDLIAKEVGDNNMAFLPKMK